MAIEFDLGSSNAVTKLEIQLNDGRPAKVQTWPALPESDGRYFRGTRFKPTENGSWLPTFTMEDLAGNRATVTCTTPIVVIL
jgi:hypothetical protein